MTRLRTLCRFLCASLLLTSCSSVFYYPSQSLYYDPKTLGYSFQQIEFHAQDGTELFAWYFSVRMGTKPKGTVLQFHGNAENMSSHFLALAWLAEQGYEFIAFDYRGYGRSQGKPSQKGTYLDGLAALNLAWDLHLKSGSERFIVIGQSLGGPIATRALEDFAHKDQVSLLVLDSTFMSYETVARRKLASFWLTWPISPLANLLISDEYGAEDALKNIHFPVLIVHDEDDPVMPISCGEDSFKLANPPKEFWELHEGAHTGAFAVPQSPYRAKLVQFLDALPTFK